ncbi:MAG TPA: hypothetical protein VGL40_09325 [Bacillota bacterium]
MKQWKKALGTALIILTMTATPALATPPSNPAAVTLTGKVTYEDLEGGYYAVNGWMLIGQTAVFQQYLGRDVVVTGIPFPNRPKRPPILHGRRAFRSPGRWQETSVTRRSSPTE